ncbi:9841_t:CDS:2 [Funneliformis caledonium]|uniref:9841_t:CDS:1 n=1 Tax=Funneliformis caledonium TaxID=1117310 RepID=A0A9N8V648_9GLOM|nr:9841_t:CDS:2 [Funneliformis caledonium]
MDLKRRQKSIIILKAVIKNKSRQDIHLLTVLTTTNIIFSSYNSFRRHFRITLTIVTSLETHQALP